MKNQKTFTFTAIYKDYTGQEQTTTKVFTAPSTLTSDEVLYANFNQLDTFWKKCARNYKYRCVVS